MQQIQNPPAPQPEPEPDPFAPHQTEVRREEEHELRVARGPPVRVAGLEERAGLGASLLHGGLDELVDELGDHEAYAEEDPLELAAEEEVGDESAEADEDGDEGDPGEEMAELVAPAIQRNLAFGFFVSVFSFLKGDGNVDEKEKGQTVRLRTTCGCVTRVL
ncbi:hypothetical protein Bca52824_069503 [Brassica carinata]|uniref:Uncharacterized protein n=1 Tax=Brassica carinata TaxID=52824 RepID=A0A8X7U274_BRACI|nr:hypothetical protein Bca52824_069503 [Brassica carinata]